MVGDREVDNTLVRLSGTSKLVFKFNVSRNGGIPAAAGSTLTGSMLYKQTFL